MSVLQWNQPIPLNWFMRYSANLVFFLCIVPWYSTGREQKVASYLPLTIKSGRWGRKLTPFLQSCALALNSVERLRTVPYSFCLRASSVTFLAILRGYESNFSMFCTREVVELNIHIMPSPIAVIIGHAIFSGFVSATNNKLPAFLWWPFICGNFDALEIRNGFYQDAH